MIDKLSVIQARILYYFCLGVSIEDIAKKCLICNATVETHKAAIYSKIKSYLHQSYGARDGIHLNIAIVINWAIQNGYYVVPDKGEYSSMLQGCKERFIHGPKEGFGIREGFVYLFYSKDRKLAKIGFSTNVKARLKRLKTLSGDKHLNLLAFKRGTFADENLLHVKYRRNSVSGEWFAFTQEELGKVCNDFSQ